MGRGGSKEPTGGIIYFWVLLSPNGALRAHAVNIYVNTYTGVLLLILNSPCGVSKYPLGLLEGPRYNDNSFLGKDDKRG